MTPVTPGNPDSPNEDSGKGTRVSYLVGGDKEWGMSGLERDGEERETGPVVVDRPTVTRTQEPPGRIGVREGTVSLLPADT